MSPRGEEVIELEDYQFTLQPRERFTNFVARKMNIAYAIREFVWYLGADRFDTSIEDHATMWKKIRDEDGGFNSQYGQYLFRTYLRGEDVGSQYDWVVEELVRDPDSRRAVMILLQPSHLRQNNPDVVCTYAISFRIRNNELKMSVSMRSNDAIFGMTNDTFCFSMIHEYVYQGILRRAWHRNETLKQKLRMGTYTHKVDSLHVYERHYGMLQELVEHGEAGLIPTEMPRASHLAEFETLPLAVAKHDRGEPFDKNPPMTAWMLEQL